MDYPVTSGSSANVVILLFFLLIGILLIPVLIGRYVYRDAKSRGMDATLWTLVAVLVPSCIGLIIYLVVRGNNITLNCPGCKSPVASDYALCPYCGMSLKSSCPSCLAPVDDGWKLCPKCGAQLPELTNAPMISAPAHKDRKLIWILAAALAIPVFILAMGILGMTSFRTTSSMMGGGEPIGYEDETIFPDVADWMGRCDETGKGIYVLKFSPEKARELQAFTSPYSSYPGSESDEIYCVVVYINEKGRVSGGGGLEQRGNTLVISYNTMDLIGAAEEKIPEYELSYAIVSGENQKTSKLRILIDGDEVEYALSLLE